MQINKYTYSNTHTWCPIERITEGTKEQINNGRWRQRKQPLKLTNNNLTHQSRLSTTTITLSLSFSSEGLTSHLTLHLDWFILDGVSVSCFGEWQKKRNAGEKMTTKLRGPRKIGFAGRRRFFVVFNPHWRTKNWIEDWAAAGKNEHTSAGGVCFSHFNLPPPGAHLTFVVEV